MNPQATNHPISWIRKFHLDGELDLSPSFQRNPVWSDAQASYLIDSILNELPVPEIFLRVHSDAKGDARVEVVDGQQRLRSIIRFFEGDLTLEGEDVTEAWVGRSWEQLSEPQRKAFFEFKLVVRELENVSNVEVRDMFRRLNANQSNLNDQELRHSQYEGRFIKLVEDLADSPWLVTHGIIPVQQAHRMLDVEYISELLVGLMAGPLDKKQGLEQFYVDYDDDFPDEDYWKRQYKLTLSLTDKVLDGDFKGWKSKTEFYSLFLACGRLVYDGHELEGEALERVQKRLAVFRENADRAKRKGNTQSFPRYVTDYAEAVSRASTDIGRRVQRIDTVEALLLGKRPTA